MLCIWPPCGFSQQENPPFKGQSKENKIPEAWQRCRSPFFMEQFKQITGKLADKNKTNFDGHFINII